MKILIDECITNSTRLVLKEAGFHLINVEEILKPGVVDESIFEYATNHKLPILTHDRGFGIIYYYTQLKPPTTVVLQVLSPHPEATNDLLKRFLSHIDLASPQNYEKLILITRNNIRIRSKK